MRKIFVLITLFAATKATAKKDLNKIAAEIVAEATILYRSEMASWYGTDLLQARNIPDITSKLGGYFSYPDGEDTKCVFYTRGERPMIFATIMFDETFNTTKATVDVGERIFTKTENIYYSIANAVRMQIVEDTFFVRYEQVSFNIIPVYDGKKKKAYIIPGTTQQGVLPFGSDYLLTFDNDYKLKTKERLHNSYVPTGCGDNVESSYHTHVEGKSPYMTVTDVCTLMLYHSVCKFESYVVVSKEYYSQWSPKSKNLLIMPMDVMKKIQEDQDKKEKATK